MAKVKAKLKFATGIHSEACLVGIESESAEMVSNDIFDCGTYDWMAYNLDIEIPPKAMISVIVSVSPSLWGQEIDEINYTVESLEFEYI